MYRQLALWLIVMTIVSAAGAVHGQAPAGRVAGVVSDSSGAVVPGATVELRPANASSTRSTRSDERGRYGFDAVPEGRYRIVARLATFDEATREDVIVEPGRQTVVDVVLEPGRQETTVVVTAVAHRPLVVETDPRAPRQPIPAHDGGDYLKTIPGFSLVRKGGTDGDPVLRGMAGSRLGILLDGQQILGGCGGRMDPPTAYVYPEAFDRITVVKGPQTVLYAAGTSAGTVLFQRDGTRAAQPEIRLSASQVAGGYGRHDEVANVRAAVPAFYVEAVGTRSHAGDYKDGAGAAVHASYTRWSGSAAVGWTPAEHTLLELSATASDGRAAYADRAMDGTKFARENIGLKFAALPSWPLVRGIEANVYYNYVDHVMDNFTLRTPGTSYSINNPDRETLGGRVAATLGGGRTSVVIGADTQHNVHTFRGAMGLPTAERAESLYRAAARNEDVRFLQVGTFGEITRALHARGRLVAGVRGDWHEARDRRACIGAAACPPTARVNDTRGARDREVLASAFGRYELDLTGTGTGTVYVGLGHAGRTPDYWERLKQDPATFGSAFLSTRSEKTTQMDAGVLWRTGRLSGSLSGFAGRIDDYVLIRWKPAPVVARNVDVTTLGAEADISHRLTTWLTAQGSIAYVRSTNDTDGKPLAQQPAPEARLALVYADATRSVGLLARMVAAQDRVDVGSGNIVANGQDLGPTAGFSVFSAHGSYRIWRGVVAAGGVDNLLDRRYAEHISQGGAMIPGFVQTTRVNEPGRTLWVKVSVGVN